MQNQHRLRAVRAILFRPTVSKRLTPGLERLLPALKKDRKGRERGHKSEARRPFTFTFWDDLSKPRTAHSDWPSTGAVETVVRRRAVTYIL